MCEAGGSRPARSWEPRRSPQPAAKTMTRRVGPAIAARSRSTATRRIATDEGGGLVRSVEITTANVHDGIMLAAVLPSDPGEVYADSAYAADRFTNVVRARGGVPRVVYTSAWGGPAALARLEAWNAEVRAVRCRIEKVFGTWKRSYGLRRMRWPRLGQTGLQVRLTATAYNLRRSATLLRVREV